MFGVLNLDKPEGITSHDAVDVVRRIYGLKKVGHLGTLDPLAGGVLPLALGQATRLIEYFPTDKRYRLEVTFGISTDTLDREGDILEARPCPELTEERLREAIALFVGTIEQEIPMHSAKKVGGKKLYELARQGVAVETAPTKTVTFYGIDLLAFQPGIHPVAVMDARCSSGTFIRALARDLGHALGCGAHLSQLTRTGHGRFTLENAVSLDDLKAADRPESFLLPPLDYIDLPLIPIEDEPIRTQIAHGMKIPFELPDSARHLRDKDLCMLTFDDAPLAVARWVDKRLKPVKVFAPQA